MKSERENRIMRKRRRIKYAIAYIPHEYIRAYLYNRILNQLTNPLINDYH